MVTIKSAWENGVPYSTAFIFATGKYSSAILGVLPGAPGQLSFYPVGEVISTAVFQS